MSGKHYGLSLGKARARTAFRRLIAKHVKLEDRRDARVLCLPGKNGYEIEQVYRKLGFRDENIVGVEYDRDAAVWIQRQYPKITVITSDVIEYVRGYSGDPFTVVNIDYTCTFSPEKLLPFYCLSYLHKLTDKAVLGVWFLGARETVKRKAWLQHMMRTRLNVAGVQSDLSNLSLARDVTMTDMFETFVSAAAQIPYIGIGTQRRNALRARVAAYLSQVKKYKDANRLAEAAVYMSQNIYAQPYFIVDWHKYKYGNEHGHPMLCDFIAVNRYRYALKAIKPYFDINSDGTWSFQFELPETQDAFEAKIEKVKTQYWNVFKSTVAPISSPPKLRKSLGKGVSDLPVREIAIEMLQAGKSNEEITARVPISVGTLSALRAHVTMGTYDASDPELSVASS